VVFKRAPYFLQMVKSELERNRDLNLDPDEIYRGLVVTTTLDLDMQDEAEAAYKASFIDTGIKPSAALVSIDNETGGIRALVGGKNYARSELNLAVGEGRQPGSTFKPFALAAWIDEGNSPKSFFDAPSEMEFTAQEINDRLGRKQAGESWTVRNYENADYGGLTLEEATWKSVNTVYAQLVLEVDPKHMRDMAEAAGIKREMEPVPSLVLGTEEVTPLELAEAYSTFATGGTHRKAHTISEIRRDGERVYRARTKGDPDALSPQVALTVTEVLKGVITSGSGTRAAIGRPAAGKTGTTQSNGDAWFVGYTPQLTTAVWMGNVANNQPMEGEYTGGSLPAQTWAAYMSAAMEGMEVRDFPAAPGGLQITRPAPPSEPATCGDDEILVTENPDGTVECEPAPEPTESEPEETEAPPTQAPEPQRSPKPKPEPEPEPEPEPDPDPEPSPRPPRRPDPEPTIDSGDAEG
jgi:penicillin-binding protein 1A